MLLNQSKSPTYKRAWVFNCRTEKPSCSDDVQKKRAEVDRIAELFRNLQLNAPARSDIAEEPNSVERGEMER